MSAYTDCQTCIEHPGKADFYLFRNPAQFLFTFLCNNDKLICPVNIIKKNGVRIAGYFLQLFLDNIRESRHIMPKLHNAVLQIVNFYKNQAHPGKRRACID